MTSATANNDIPVVILCGGLGTRLREVSDNIPKPLVDIGGRPILWHIMKLYSEQGFRRFVLCLGYKSWSIKEYFLRYRENLADFTIHLGTDGNGVKFHNDEGLEDWEVTCVETGLLTGTGGRIARVRDHLDNGTFFMTYGDGIADVDLHALLARHREAGTLGTVTGVKPVSRYGELVVSDDKVDLFAEKPDAQPGWASGGFFVFDPGVFDYLSTAEELMLEQGPLGQMARDGQLAMYQHHGFWVGMDTPREYTMLNRLWHDGEAPWAIWDRSQEGGS